MQVLSSRDSRLARDRHSQCEKVLNLRHLPKRPCAGSSVTSATRARPTVRPSESSRAIPRTRRVCQTCYHALSRHTAVAVAVRGISLSRRAPLVRIGDGLRVTSPPSDSRLACRTWSDPTRIWSWASMDHWFVIPSTTLTANPSFRTVWLLFLISNR